MAKKKIPNKLSFEKDNAELAKFIQEQNFTMDELKEFFSQIQGKTINEIVPKKRGRKSNKETAHELIIEAYDLSPSEGIKLVEKALKLDPDNIDGYLYLASNESDIKKALKIYEKAVKIGEKNLGKDKIEEYKGHFWGFHETRPFMRAKAEYAACLYASKKYNEAIKQYSEMIELNPNDNQGVRCPLAIYLVEQGKEKEYLGLYKEYNDEAGTLWLFTYALYLFKKEGKTKRSDSAIQKVHKSNKHIVKFLTGEKKMPGQTPQFIGIGDENEAVYCLHMITDLLFNTLGAISWIKGLLIK